MKIIYVAKHDSGGNDDEGAIYHSLQQLGHEVHRVREVMGKKAYRLNGDFLLFHKWDDAEVLSSEKLRGIPKVFWYFDLVKWPDPSLTGRNRTRLDWMSKIIPQVQLGFCTDGDWVSDWTDCVSPIERKGKLVWLPQGADERVIGFGKPFDAQSDVMFSGIGKGGGEQRVSFVEHMRSRYGERFHHITRHHGKSLADCIASSKMVVAPDSPVTDRYWSNRVYMTLGFGGFLLHPYCAELARHYAHGEELVFYRSREELDYLVSYYMDKPGERSRIAVNGFKRTQVEHTYRHRCEVLVRTVKERLAI